MAVEQGKSWVVGDKIDVNSAEAFDKNGVFENSGGFFSVNFRDLKIMPMQMERMQVVALVDESEPIAATLMNLDRLALPKDDSRQDDRGDRAIHSRRYA